jgi:hypothetical protein
MAYKFVLIIIVLSVQCTLAQDTVRYIGTRAERKTVSFQGPNYSVQIYKKEKRAGVAERTMYFDRDYYRFQYLGDGVTKLLRANEVVATRKDDSLFIGDHVYRMTYDEKYHAYDFKRDTSNVLTVQHWVSDSSDYDESYDIDVAVYESLSDVHVLQLFGFETVSRHIKFSGISRTAGIVIISATTAAIVTFMKSKLDDDDTL